MGRIRRWLRKRSPEGLILLYHRVATLESDPQLLSVTPRHFADHLEVLCRYYRRATLADIASDGGFRETAVMITFDDGYADNLYEALPILSASEWPATVFITTGQIGQNCEFWWDELERIFLRTARVPATLRLTIAGRELVWHISDCEQSPDPTWNVLRNKTRTGRQCAYIDLATLLRGLDAAEREKVLDVLRTWARLSPPGRPSHRSLGRHELCALTMNGLVEIGAHTVNHPSLAALSLPGQRAEIFVSRYKPSLTPLVAEATSTEIRSNW